MGCRKAPNLALNNRMIFGYLTLATALIISLSAAVYSILGLTAIFAAAFWPIVIMGGSLEVGKIVTTLWLHKYWDRAELQYKVYLCSAVAILMLLTSMGVFGFLSKAHTDQGLVSGDVVSKIAIYDEKIKISRDNIDANRKALKQMDEAVDQSMARSTTEQGADKAVAIRRSQQAERNRLLKEIDAEQKKITALNEERAPIAAEVRKVDAEVGPIKYIAALIYGDNPDANILEKAVRWVIILIVIVFDPLALTLLLAATKSIEWEHGVNLFNVTPRKKEEEETNDSTEEDIDAINKELIEAEDPKDISEKIYVHQSDYKVIDDADEEEVIQPIVETVEIVPESTTSETTNKKVKRPPEPIPSGTEIEQQAMSAWKVANPQSTFKEQYDLLDSGKIKRLPWEQEEHINTLPVSDGERARLKTAPVPDNEIISGNVRGFGTNFPDTAIKGDMFLRVDALPSQLFKYNGQQWIRVNKNLSDTYAYDDEYINHLIAKIGSGEYDPDLLSDAERERISEKLKTTDI